MDVSGNTPKPGDTVRVRLDYVGEVDEVGDMFVPTSVRLDLGAFIPVTRPDDLHVGWTVEVVTPPMDEPTALGTVVVDADGYRAVCVGDGLWLVVGGMFFRWSTLTQPVRLATEEEKQSHR